MAVNDLAESSFAGDTYQLQLFCIIGISSAADISDMDSNGFLDRLNSNKYMSYKKTIIFHDFSEELHITTIMCAAQ